MIWIVVFRKSIYKDPNIFIVYWWWTDLYFNYEKNQIGDIEIMTSEYGSSGSFGSRVRSKSIDHNIYTDRRSNFLSKPTPIHVLVQKTDLDYFYSRSHFSKSVTTSSC